MQLLQQLEIVPPPGAERSGGPFPDAVNGEDRRRFEGRWEERAGRVRLMMLGVEHLAVVAEGVLNLAAFKQFFLHPPRPLGAEPRKHPWSDSSVCSVEPLQLR